MGSNSYSISCETAESITVPVVLTPPTGGNIKTFDSSKVGSYICNLTTTSKPMNLAVDSSFTFFLTILPIPTSLKSTKVS